MLGIFRFSKSSRTYAALYAEVSRARGELLEAANLILILIEILIAVLYHAS